MAEVSDVDVALVLLDGHPGDAGHVQELAERVRRRDRSPLASRLSVFWTDEPSLR